MSSDDGGSTSETSVSFFEIALRHILEDSHLHTCRREKLKSHHADVLEELNSYTLTAV
jgi:hypothetical protein